MTRKSYYLLATLTCCLSVHSWALAAPEEMSAPRSSSFSSSTNLFLEIPKPATSALSLSPEEESRGILSRHTVDLSASALRNGSSINIATDVRMASTTQGEGQGFVMRLPGGSQVTLETNRVHSYVRGVETYSGRVKDIATGYFTLSIEDGKVYGQVNIEFMAYDIRYDAMFRSHVLTEIDLARMPKHSPDPLRSGAANEAVPKTANMPDAMSGSSNSTVRVLILYASDVSNATTLASNIISKMNDTFFDDGVDADLHVTLADLRQLNSDLDDVCKEDVLEKMQDETFPFISIATWMDNEDADVALTIATTDANITGCESIYGRIGGQASALLDSTMPYAVTMDTYAIGDLTAIHELGHVFGGGHSIWTVSTLAGFSDDAEPYSRGYIGDDGEWQTVMGAYEENGCNFVQLPSSDCTRLPLWSDPSKSYDSETRGVTYTSDTQVPYSADMVAALEFQMPLVAAYESYPNSSPGLVSGISVDRCYQNNIIDWSTVTNAENYQVLRSYSSGFTNPEVIYFASQASVNVRIYQGNPTEYVKIRACNGSGCGAYSAQQTLTYNSSCN